MYAAISHAISRIWKQAISQDFRDGRIASERELQACLYAHLREEVSATALGHARIFVEPSLKGAGDRLLKRFPDMVVCVPNDNQSGMDVIAVVELKMDRGRYIRFEHEFARIIELGDHSEVWAKVESGGERRWCPLAVSDRTRFFLGFLGSHDAKAVHKEDLCSSAVGKRFLTGHPTLASRTTLLFGRVHPDGATLFDGAPLLVEAAGVIA